MIHAPPIGSSLEEEKSETLCHHSCRTDHASAKRQT